MKQTHRPGANRFSRAVEEFCMKLAGFRVGHHDIRPAEDARRARQDFQLFELDGAGNRPPGPARFLRLSSSTAAKITALVTMG